MRLRQAFKGPTICQCCVRASVNLPHARRVAVKTMTKRYGPDGLLEANFVRRVQHEVDMHVQNAS